MKPWASLALGSVALLLACGTADVEAVSSGPGADGGADASTADGGAPASSPDAGSPELPPLPPLPPNATCGADAGVACGAGAPCASDDDCEGRCGAGAVCEAATTLDGKRSPSLGESDVDCGGPTAPGCAEGKGCATDRDCASGVCSALTKTCVAAPSCRGGANGPAGLETCGSGEPGSTGAVHESCCRSLPLPQRTTRRLDRYEITSGRLRAFIEALAAKNGGKVDLRGFAKAYAAAHPTSQLADVAVGYPGLLDILPADGNPNAPGLLSVMLGAYVYDPINATDGCYVGDGSYGHPTYWQPPSVLAPYGIGASDGNGGTDGKRMFSREQLDEKPVNCVMPLVLSAFCAWDGGELARADDYREIWGNHPFVVGDTTVFVPWSKLLAIGEFNWRNGHGAECTLPWPGCQDVQPYHYEFPLPHFPANDDTPAIGAPGRFPLDVTAIRSADGSGWFDVGGNLLETAWLSGPLLAGPVKDVCDASATPGPGDTGCTRQDHPGVRRFEGDVPGMFVVGYSWEGHLRYGEKYISAESDDQSTAGLRAITFQYGKVGGRCARPAP